MVDRVVQTDLDQAAGKECMGETGKVLEEPSRELKQEVEEEREYQWPDQDVPDSIGWIYHFDEDEVLQIDLHARRCQKPSQKKKDYPRG